MCKKCGKPKTTDEFYKHNKSTCKECIKKAAREYKKQKRKSKESRHEEYRRQAIKDGSMTRAGVAYITMAPIGNLRWCIRCKKYMTIENFRKTKIKHSRFDNIDYHDTICDECTRHDSRKRYVPHPRPKKTEDPRLQRFLNWYLVGDGCCLYCGKTDFWKLNNHHPWKKIDPNFTITLCENHHTFCTRRLPFLLEEWY